MIQAIHIQNIALISKLTIDFHDGLNILSGETGAGKSILVGSIHLILGGKFNAQFIRSGETKGSVEIVFNISKVPGLIEYLSTQDLDLNLSEDDYTIILRREIHEDGRSKVTINHKSITLSLLKSIGEYLIDITSQREHQSLLRVEHHLTLVDQYGSLESDAVALKEVIFQHSECLGRMVKFQKEKEEKQKQSDFLNYAIDEIGSIDPKPHEDHDLEQELMVLNNHHELMNHLSVSYSLLYEDEGSILTRIDAVLQSIAHVVKIRPSFQEVYTEISESQVKLDAMKDVIRQFRDELDLSPDRLRIVNERIDQLYHLKKKYGDSIEKIIAFKEQCVKEVDHIVHFEEELEALVQEKERLEETISIQARQLSQKRQRAAKQLESDIVREIQYLGMEKAQFKVEFRYIKDPESFLKIDDTSIKIYETGIDRIEFTFSANPGEPLQSLAKIASGGELSRVMLAIKLILSEVDEVPTLVFDEIEEGVGGESNFKIASKVEEISKKKQVLCITHTPQIASRSDHHYRVDKNVVDGRTQSSIKQLDDHEKLMEIARLLAGDNPSPDSINYAKELISKRLLP